jgi:asparagine synthase (glutamine-hydrolysing)
MDEPVANHIQPSTYLLAKYAKPEITVALGGDGGDELFAGYSRYWYANMAERLHSFVPTSLAHSFLNKRLAEKLTAKTHAERFRSFQGLDEDRVSLLISKTNPDLSGYAGPEALMSVIVPLFHQMPKNGDIVTDCLEADLRTWLPSESLVRTDKLSMAHALEARVPLLDLELVSYAFRIPSAFKLGKGLKGREQGKRVFIDAMRQYLPEHVLGEKKRGWMSPSAKWIREEPMLSWVREILSPSYAPGSEAFLDFDGLQKILDQHLQKEVYGLHEIWLAITFQIWYREFICRSSEVSVL